MANWNVDIGGKSYSIPVLALSLMLAAILLPALKYSLMLNNPTAAELLVAISISLFASVLFLWILDATSVLPFRSEWISKSIYGAAIVSVLGTSVGVYSDYFKDRKYPYEGEWIVSTTMPGFPTPVTELSAVLTYSKQAETYWGYSQIEKPIPKIKAAWLEVFRFKPEEESGNAEIVLRLIFMNGNTLRITGNLKKEGRGTIWRGLSDDTITTDENKKGNNDQKASKWMIELSRRK
jgi:hypothetical protein